MRTLDTYHTCRDQGGAKFILSNAPFISEDNSRQWLGQGFDFRAVKVATQKSRELRRFIPGKNEVLGSNPRQQICVFPEYKCAIFKVHIEKPEGWKGKFKGVRKWTNMKRALRHFVSYWKR